ncbi:MAG: hypothetical protein JXB34_12435 [Bacteroidales bacterium]|nr:hypothetical protein [Bacteroidales bacterium]
MATNNTEYIIKRDFQVTSADVDFEGVLKLSALTNYFIQAAWQHAEILGWGVSELQKDNLAWVLSGFKIEIAEYPEWKQSITVETWPKGINRLFYLRDFIMYGNKGKVLARATTNWLLIDIDKRRPKLAGTGIDLFEMNSGKHAIKETVPALSSPDSFDLAVPFDIRYSNIDINQHLTTTGYIDFIFDTYNPEFISGERPKFLVANFLKEVKFGSKVEMLRSGSTGNHHMFELRNRENNLLYFRGAVGF